VESSCKALASVLVIDDDPDFCEFVEIVLTAHGYQVRLASAAPEALTCLRQATPDVVIADVMLSYALDGWSVLREMRADEQLANVPVLLVSAVVRGGDEEVFPEGDDLWDRFLRKPISPDELVRALRELMPDNKEAA